MDQQHGLDIGAGKMDLTHGHTAHIRSTNFGANEHGTVLPTLVAHTIRDDNNGDDNAPGMPDGVSATSWPAPAPAPAMPVLPALPPPVFPKTILSVASCALNPPSGTSCCVYHTQSLNAFPGSGPSMSGLPALCHLTPLGTIVKGLPLLKVISRPKSCFR